MSTTHQRAVWLGKITEHELLRLSDKVTFPTIETLKEANEILNTTGVHLRMRLQYLFRGPLATLPCLFVFDDFQDGNLEASASGTYIGTPEALDVLAALLEAIRTTNSRSRVIITSRFTFPMDARYRVLQEGLESMQGAELEKKLQLSSALRLDSSIPPALRERAIATAAGNPRLLEWLDRVLADAQTDHDALLAAMEGKAAEFREDVLAAELLHAQPQALRRLLACVNIFALPVPREAVQAVAGAIPLEPHVSRAVSLGLLEAGVDPLGGGQRYFVSNVLAPLLATEITEEERQDAYRAGARALYALWVTGDQDAN
jgi:hypothetical protein